MPGDVVIVGPAPRSGDGDFHGAWPSLPVVLVEGGAAGARSDSGGSRCNVRYA